MTEVESEFFVSHAHDHLWIDAGEMRVGESKARLMRCAIEDCPRKAVEEPFWEEVRPEDHKYFADLLAGLRELSRSRSNYSSVRIVPNMDHPENPDRSGRIIFSWDSRSSDGNRTWWSF
jgi:hypothetical protein